MKSCIIWKDTECTQFTVKCICPDCGYRNTIYSNGPVLDIVITCNQCNGDYGIFIDLDDPAFSN